MVSSALGNARGVVPRQASSSELSLWASRLRRLGVEEETARQVVSAAEMRVPPESPARATISSWKRSPRCSRRPAA